MMTFHQALAILKKDEEEERNWRSARAKLAEVVAAAIEADTALQPVTKQKQALESDVAALRTDVATLNADYQRLQKSYGQLDAEHRARKQQLEATLSTVLAELAAAQQLKHDTEEQLATITAKWQLKTGHAAAE